MLLASIAVSVLLAFGDGGRLFAPTPRARMMLSVVLRVVTVFVGGQRWDDNDDDGPAALNSLRRKVAI